MVPILSGAIGETKYSNGQKPRLGSVITLNRPLVAFEKPIACFVLRLFKFAPKIYAPSISSLAFMAAERGIRTLEASKEPASSRSFVAKNATVSIAAVAHCTLLHAGTTL